MAERCPRAHLTHRRGCSQIGVVMKKPLEPLTHRLLWERLPGRAAGLRAGGCGVAVGASLGPKGAVRPAGLQALGLVWERGRIRPAHARWREFVCCCSSVTAAGV